MKRRKAVCSITAMLGYSLSPAALTTLVSSCKEGEKEVGWKPNFFQEEEIPLLAKLGEAFLPRTETPGAIDVDAHRFVDVFLAKVATKEDRETVRTGFVAWKKAFAQTVGKSVENTHQEDFVQNLEYYYGEKAAEMEAVLNMPMEEMPHGESEVERMQVYGFLKEFKRLILLGYFTSEQIGENVLEYLPVPGDYQGCIPVSSVGNAWSIN